MSQGVQVTKRCSALIDRSVEACVAALDKVARQEGNEWLAFTEVISLVCNMLLHIPHPSVGVPLFLRAPGKAMCGATEQ